MPSRLPARQRDRAASARRHKVQSAMEYLMTYGWAILVIAVVLGVLYSMGVFNPQNFSPKAQPGSCQVLRPNGPGTSYDINLEGTCGGELPQYVALFNNGNITMNASGLTNQRFTIAFWFYEPSYPNTGSYPSVGVGNGFAYGVMYLLPQVYDVNGGATVGNALETYVTNTAPPVGKWNFVATTYNGTEIRMYLDGTLSNWHSYSGTVDYSYSYGVIGGASGYDAPSIGGYYLSNVQMYNTSLSNSSMATLYGEGIGGAPIQLQNLVGWWPLNGDANDYSGNNNDGAPTNVIYTGTWSSTYTPP